MEINYQKLVLENLGRILTRLCTNLQVINIVEAMLKLLFATLLLLLHGYYVTFVILFYCISVTFFCGMCPANLKQLLLLILFLAILTKLCITFSLFLYYKLLSNVKF